MSAEKYFTTDQAREIGEKLGVDWSRFDVEQFRMGMDVELEHGRRDPATDVTGDDALTTGKIALAHLNEFADYYTRLTKMERKAKKQAEKAARKAEKKVAKAEKKAAKAARKAQEEAAKAESMAKKQSD
jgi:hypothetical protein